MDLDKTMVKADGSFVQGEDGFPEPESAVFYEISDSHGDLGPVNPDCFI